MRCSYPPYLFLDEKHESPIEYGSFMSLQIEATCGPDMATLEYQSAGFGDVYILIAPNSATLTDASIDISSACGGITSCHANQYLSDGLCEDCPTGFVSMAGSSGINDCFPCTQYGAQPIHPTASKCVLPSSPARGNPSGQSWRFLTYSDLLSTSWIWDVTFIEFYQSPDCSGEALDTSDAANAAIDSGNAGDFWRPQKAFQDSGTWGGRSDENDVFYIGYHFPSDQTIRCAVLRQASKQARKVFVQVFDEETNNWTTAWIQDNLVVGTNIMLFENGPAAAPSAAPVIPPFSAPVAAPLAAPASAPVAAPVAAPVSTPVAAPIASPVSSDPEEEPDNGVSSCGFFQQILQLLLGWLFGLFGVSFC